MDKREEEICRISKVKKQQQQIIILHFKRE